MGCGILYFMIALLDKWILLLSGHHTLDILAYLDDARRMAVGFALAYYLIGAVLIDTKAQELHVAIGGNTPTAVKDASEIRPSQKSTVHFRRKVYWRTLGSFLLWHVWSLAVSLALIWSFQEYMEAMIMFFAYVLSYTGLIWYQYTKIFLGPHALKPLLVGVCVGLPVGIALTVCLPKFPYSQVIGLGSGTWTVAIIAFLNSKMGMPGKMQSPVALGTSYHAFTTPWADPEWSQQELQSYFETVSYLPDDSRFAIHPAAHPGLEIKNILLSRREEVRIHEAFPNAKEIVETTLSRWENGGITIELRIDLRLAVSVRGLHDERLDISANCQIIAETLLHSVAESIAGIPHEYAVLAEAIVSGGVTHTMARQLREEANSSVVVRWAKKELLKQLCLGFEADLHWDKLPEDVRLVLLNRCLGRSCALSSIQRQWLQSSLCQFDTPDLDTHIARCNLGAATAISILDYSVDGTGENAIPKEPETADYIPYMPRKLPVPLAIVRSPMSYIYHGLGAAVKFIVIALMADPEFQREFDHVAKSLPTIVRVPSVFCLNMLWVYAKFAQDLGLSFFLFHGRKNVKRLWDDTKGMLIHVKKNRVLIQSLDGTFTAFRHQETDGGFKVYQYAGEHNAEPKEAKSLKYVSTYSSEMLLLIKQEFKDGKVINEYHYDYHAPEKRGFKMGRSSNTRIPLGRRCVTGENYLQSVQYNKKGLIEKGSYMKDGNLIRFLYHYRKHASFGDELLRAEFSLSHITCNVAWCVPPRRQEKKDNRWIPHSKVTSAMFVQRDSGDVYQSTWLYDHKFHPTIFTLLHGKKVTTPPMIEHDYLGVLSKPSSTSFVNDNPFVHCNSLHSNFFTRLLGLTKKRFSVSTSRARSLMWKAWEDRVDFDGIIVRWMDDRILRRDAVLAPYWRSRDWGNLKSAKKFMDLRGDAVMASADLDDNISSWTPLAVKISDLFNFGPGGDAVVTTRSREAGSDTKDNLHVMAADTGTWPNEGGGVSACRRDMINSLRSIKWHIICEAANDFGVPKHQTERNIQSLKVIPLWGLDFLTPTHGLFENKLDSEVENVTSASEFDIKMNFIPILTALVKGARAVNLTKADIHQATRALVNLNTYFQDSRHWTQVWNSEMVKQTWRELWLTQDMPNTIPSSEWLDIELPTLSSLEIALVSASYGVVCKIKRNVTLQIWDHAISWRETNLCLSSALCKLSPFVRNALLGLMRITSVLTLHHADIILPCADFFNPGWEVEIGTCQGTIEHRNMFRRKVDPVVNGITDMQKFSPVKEIKSERPTVTMLSHVWYAKDIKIALLAADIIVNQWKFDDYHLDIYGAIDKAPTYSTECQEIIASKGLRGRVTLRGTADPMKVLENTWLFLNSSLSEGLPLALGEAALTGAPVVCTDVGASLRVLSDPDDFSRFSAVVAPNDAQALARAQISMLAMLGEWDKYTDNTGPCPILTSTPTREEVVAIQRRMYEHSESRRKLGMRTRQIVQKSFSGDRYLREHEQMLWIGKAVKLMASRAAGDILEPQIAAVDEEVITIPPSAVQTWRSSAASGMSGMSTLYSSVSNYSLQGTRNRPDSSISALSLSNFSNDEESYSRLPIFAPRRSALSLLSAGNRSPNPFSNHNMLGPYSSGARQSHLSARSISTNGREQVRGLHREDLMQYRNSDVSIIMREDFLRSGMLWSG
ncbi:Glycosyl transferase family 1 [Penicillium maclennaniae]|uniref:Glycosyl transferase family 1 n=1 Tax=Penicillium maclennaniae TaxID=1343394 RepID=UPI002540562B|nr:Glycosyl transferase family 1 [Penicillium maclennaniae]KAJ5668074.1 Glycosyl transferase family 1 [Penicillium maclennaniae]